MKIAIKAVQIARGGGLTHLNKIIEWFGVLAPQTEFVLIGRSGQEQLFMPPPANFRYEFHKMPALHLSAQILWERYWLPDILTKLGTDLLFEPGNRGTLKSPCPKVSMIHNLAPFYDDYLARETPYQKIRQWLLRRSTFQSVRASAGVIFISEFSRGLFSRLMDLSSIRTAVIYHGRPEVGNDSLDSAILARHKIEKPYILNVSNIWRYKKVLEMVRAYGTALERNPGLPPLLIAGENYSPAYMDEITEHISDPGTWQNIRFLGNIPENDLPALYRNCRSFLFPSVIEACPNVLIEAMACGCAVISSNRGVMPEITAGAALYCDPDNIGDFASKIISVACDDDLNAFLGRNARRRAFAFSWKSTARQTLSFFDDVLGGQKSGAPAMGRHPKPEHVEV
jgi:glycosyltransferase involved in cell wall biosynthesis